MTAFLVGLGLGALLASAGWIIWAYRAMDPRDDDVPMGIGS